MDPTLEVLLSVYREERDQGRQSEDQRATLANLVLIIAAGALVAFVANLRFQLAAALPAAFIVLLGVYGCLGSLKLSERFQLHQERASEIRRRINELVPDAKIEELRSQASANHQKDHRVLNRVHLSWFWVALHLLVASAGVIVLLIVILRNVH